MEEKIEYFHNPSIEIVLKFFFKIQVHILINIYFVKLGMPFGKHCGPYVTCGSQFAYNGSKVKAS